jgi:hypothetical protein
MSHIPYYGQAETETKRAAKNGYEIRAQILELAKDYVENQYKANLEYVNRLADLQKITTEEYLKLTKPYNMDTIMSHVDKMYNFVMSKK